MHELAGDIWHMDGAVRVIPTNGIVKKADASGVRRAVMGAGLALQAAQRYPRLPVVLADCILNDGNVVNPIRHDIVAFPTKFHYLDRSDQLLIARSARQLLKWQERMDWEMVVLPRVGCGKGQLSWDQVRPILESVLGGNPHFVVVDNS